VQRMSFADAVRRVVATASTFAILLASAAAAAQPSWPDRSIQLIVPFPAGGGVDVIARPFAEQLSTLLGQPVVVVPRDGASGTIGMAAVASAKPDGYTLAFTPNGPVTIQPHVIPTLSYTFDGVVPLCQIFAVQYVLAVKPDSPLRTLADLVNAAKAKPGDVKYGYGGVATNPHLAMSQLVLASGIDVLAVPYRGDPQAILALKAGDIDAAAMNIGGAKAQGFRMLVTFADARQPEIPDVPTLKESGYQVVSSAFGGLFAPKGIAPDVARKIDAACRRIVEDERYRQTLRQAFQEPVYRSGAEFTQVLANDLAVKGDVVRRAGIKAN
jgi:tripartite-type tricarboxylate transporter receptor subunit TctC